MFADEVSKDCVVNHACFALVLSVSVISCFCSVGALQMCAVVQALLVQSWLVLQTKPSPQLLSTNCNVSISVCASANGRFLTPVGIVPQSWLLPHR